LAAARAARLRYWSWDVVDGNVGSGIGGEVGFQILDPVTIHLGFGAYEYDGKRE
jgi:hypothetical protein